MELVWIGGAMLAMGGLTTWLYLAYGRPRGEAKPNDPNQPRDLYTSGGSDSG